MDLTLRQGVTIFANFCLMAALIVYAFRWFAQYHTSGKWTKNITGLLAGIGFPITADGSYGPATKQAVAASSADARNCAADGNTATE